MYETKIIGLTGTDWQNAVSALETGTSIAEHGFLNWDVRTGNVVWDAKWSALFGLPPGIGHGNAGLWEKAIHHHDLCEVMEKLNEHLRGDSDIFVAEYRLEPGCGQPHSVRTSAIALARNASGRPNRVIMTSLKIAPLEYTMARRYESPLKCNA